MAKKRKWMTVNVNREKYLALKKLATNRSARIFGITDMRTAIDRAVDDIIAGIEHMIKVARGDYEIIDGDRVPMPVPPRIE